MSPRFGRVRCSSHEIDCACAATPYPPSALPDPSPDISIPRLAERCTFVSQPVTTRESHVVPTFITVLITLPPRIPVPACIGGMVDPSRSDLPAASGGGGEPLLTPGRCCGTLGVPLLLMTLRRPCRSGRRMKWLGRGPSIAIRSAAPIVNSMIHHRANGAAAVPHVCVPTGALSGVACWLVVCHVFLIRDAVSASVVSALGKLKVVHAPLPISLHPSPPSLRVPPSGCRCFRRACTHQHIRSIDIRAPSSSTSHLCQRRRKVGRSRIACREKSF